MCEMICCLRKARRLAASVLVTGIVALLMIAGDKPANAQSNTIYLPVVVAGGDVAPPPEPTDVRPPANFAELIIYNTDAGIWTEEEGIIRTLEFFAGKRTLSDLPGGR